MWFNSETSQSPSASLLSSQQQLASPDNCQIAPISDNHLSRLLPSTTNNNCSNSRTTKSPHPIAAKEEAAAATAATCSISGTNASSSPIPAQKIVKLNPMTSAQGSAAGLGSGQQASAGIMTPTQLISSHLHLHHLHHHHHHRPQPAQIPGQVSFHLKTSIFTQRITVDLDKMALGLVKQLAIKFLNDIYFQHSYPPNTFIGDYIRRNFDSQESLNALLGERLVLRKYNCEQESFVPFNSVSDIEPESYISIEISEKHLLMSEAQLGGPPGAVPSANSGSPIISPANSESAANHSSTSSSSLATSSASGGQVSKVQLHDFKSDSFLRPTHCASCTLAIGVFRQAYPCSGCKKIFCPKCKSKAESFGELCAASSPANSALSPAVQPANNGAPSSSGGPNHASNDRGAGANNADSGDGCSSQQANRSDHFQGQSASMSKRKSGSNLLNFNNFTIVNPFSRGHHQPASSQQQQQVKQNQVPGAGASPGGRPTDGQQADRWETGDSKQPARTQSPADEAKPGAVESGDLGNSLRVAQATHLSSSHQNLFVASKGGPEESGKCLIRNSNSNTTANRKDSYGRLTTGEILAGSSSVHQSPIGGPQRGYTNQLSTSARTSAQNLHLSSSKADHCFISMDWIQIKGEPACAVCSKSLKGLSGQAQSQAQSQSMAPFMCKNCKLQVHNQCQNLVLDAGCMSRIAESSRAAAERPMGSPEAQAQPPGPPANQTAAGRPDKQASGSGVRSSASNQSRDNIRLHRLAPSVKHIKRPDLTKPIIEGWLRHTTLADEQARKHYWRLDATDITMYENDTSTRYFKAIALNKITRVMSAQSLPKRVREDVLANSALANKQPAGAKSANSSPAKSPQLLAQMNAMFAFELATGSMYLVQASSESEASRWKESLASVTQAKQQAAPETAPADQLAGAAAQLVDSVNRLNLGPANRDLGEKTGPPPGEPAANVPETPPKVQKEAPASGEAGKQVTPAAADCQLQPPDGKQPKQVPVQRQHHHRYPPTGGHYRGQHKTYTDPNRSRLYNRPRITIQLDPMAIPDHWIEGRYLIERDRIKGVGFEELGSGQFGKVYAAISEWKAEDSSKGLWSGVPVAIKEISKARFDLRQQAKLKNEANILSRLDHPGVIILERVHDLSDKIYIVMEQLEDDMLEMIVSTEEKRLNERITKFLTYQILEALKYLHSQNIAHCDLKPENVLLVERRSQFPQIKLCDFGFAKIIEENSFRSSLVGTPAYLAPEVVKGERYNRSVDLWSVGVIIYVSLSGEFPFNEGENIHDQISRANFMYPDHPWAKISNQAKMFINSLLRVNCEKRLSANRAQMDDWIQDFQLWCDLSELEVRVGRRWVTDDADFERWSRYAREHNLQVPRSAIQLHEDLSHD